MTLSALLADLYRRLGYASTPATEVTTRLTTFLNQAVRDVLSEPGMDELFDNKLTFVSVASQPQYALTPVSAVRIKKIYETTNDIALLGLSHDAYRTYDPDTASYTGNPTHWVDFGFSGVAMQPSNASQIFVDSTSAADTNTATIEGIRTGGYSARVSATMTGTTAVAFSFSDWIEIYKFYLSASANGTVTLHEDASGGTELAAIGQGSLFSRYRRIALWPCPSSAITYTVDYQRDPTDMADANDEPALPFRFQPMLVERALMKEWHKKEDARFEFASAEYARYLGNLKYFMQSSLDHRPVMRGQRTLQRPSQLGGWYPSGS